MKKRIQFEVGEKCHVRRSQNGHLVPAIYEGEVRSGKLKGRPRARFYVLQKNRRGAWGFRVILRTVWIVQEGTFSSRIGRVGYFKSAEDFMKTKDDRSLEPTRVRLTPNTGTD